MSAVMGVDPGVRGGVVVLDEAGRPIFLAPFEPKMEDRDLVELLFEAGALLLSQADIFGNAANVCYFEKVGYMRGDGGKGAFTFGKVVGLLRAALLAQKIVIRDVYPALWQAKMECLTGGNKVVSKKRAQELFPGVKVTHAIADALLIASYGRLRMLAETDGA